jgi:hypothetical protein
MFEAYYDKNRFRYWHKELLAGGLVKKHHDRTLFRKTGCFYGDKLNLYIDTSDGVNEDLRIPEYTGRIKWVIQDSRRKPFLYFKSAYSPVWSKNIVKLAEEAGGKVLPFFKWSFNDNFYEFTWPRRAELRQQSRNASKNFDLGFAAKLKPYYYPKFDGNTLAGKMISLRNRLLKKDQKDFSYELNSRKSLHNLVAGSRFSFYFQESVPYEKFIKESMSWRAALNPPGIGEYTSRMFDHACLGQCVILRETSYDFGNSYKEYLPEVDFEATDWEEQVRKILNNVDEWREKSLDYFEHKWSPQALTKYFKESIEKL